MPLESLAAQALTTFLTTLFMIVAMAPVARGFGLTDKPTQRKRHQGDVPLIGGICIFLSLTVVNSPWGVFEHNITLVNYTKELRIFTFCAAFIVLIGVLDDRFGLSVVIRSLSEVSVALVVIELLDLRLSHLGDLFGLGILHLGSYLSYPFTVVSIYGIINAFNMLDGVDGLLAGLVLCSLALFHLILGVELGMISLTVAASLLAFLISNLGLSPLIPKTFLGDAGSKLLGFIVACLLLSAASAQVGGIKIIKPVTALFVVSVPLFDMVFTTLRRFARGASPVAADRSHIHHLLHDLGFSIKKTLVIILCLHSSLAIVGLLMHRANTPEYYQLAIFLGCFGLYSLLSGQLWLVAAKLQSSPPSRLKR